MANSACPSCGFRGKPTEEDGYMLCSHCGTNLGEKVKKPHIIWGFLLTLAALFFGRKQQDTDKKSKKHGRRKKKAISFKRAYLTQMAVVTAFVLIIYKLNSPYSEDVGALLTGLEFMYGFCLVICAFIALAINDMSKPIFDEYEDD